MNLFLWVIKNQLDFNMCLKYLAKCSNRLDIVFLPYGMILTPFLAKFKVKLNEKPHLLIINATLVFTMSHLHKIQLEQDNQGKWERKKNTKNPNPTKWRNV